MIKEHCFTDEWLDSFKKQKEHKRIDKAILEKIFMHFIYWNALKPVDSISFSKVAPA